MAGIKISLDTRRPKKDQTYPVILRVTQNGKSTSVSVGINLLEKDWDTHKRQVRQHHLRFWEDYQANILNKVVKQNTISFYLRTVRNLLCVNK